MTYRYRYVNVIEIHLKLLPWFLKSLVKKDIVIKKRFEPFFNRSIFDADNFFFRIRDNVDYYHAKVQLKIPNKMYIKTIRLSHQ